MKSYLPLAAMLLATTLCSGQDGKPAGNTTRPDPLASGTLRTNTVDGSILVWVPAGEFKMGSTDGNEDEIPVTKPKVKGFWLGKFEVTNEQFAKFLAETGCDPSSWRDDRNTQPNQPVMGIRWSAARAYCKWAGLRLPTEAEWEHSARGGKHFQYPTATGRIDPSLANYFDSKGVNHRDGPSPVGSFLPNPYGIHDMAGNAWEWTGSLYQAYPASSEDENTDDVEERRGFRVMRGGCWRYSADYCSSSHRHRFQGHLTYDYAGIRVALSLKDVSPPDKQDNP